MDGLMQKSIVFAVMLLIAAMSGLGVGSGGLLVIFLTSFLSFPATDARVTNLLFFVISATGAFLVHSYRRRIKYRLVIFVSILGCIGTVIGSAAGQLIGDTLLKFLFGILLLISGFMTIFGKKILQAVRFLSAARKNIKFKL